MRQDVAFDLSLEADEIQARSLSLNVDKKKDDQKVVNYLPEQIPSIESLTKLLNEGEISPDEFKETVEYFYPSVWVEEHIRDPLDESKKMKLWSHQVLILDHPSHRKALRLARQIGKTTTIVLKALHIVVKNKGRTVVCFAPQQKHIDNLFSELDKYIYLCDEIIDLSSKKMVKEEDIEGYAVALISSTKRPMVREFSNGSKIMGVILKTSGDDMGLNARGISASDVFFDEAAFIPPGAFSAALLTTRAYTRPTIWVSSTPTLFGIKFKEICQDPSFFEIHKSAEEAENWTKELETFYRNKLTAEEYTLDILAEWGDTEEGVFKKKYIERIGTVSVISVGDGGMRRRYRYSDVDKMIDAGMFTYFVIGVDWNKPAYGTRIVVVGVTKDLNVYLLESLRVSSDYEQLFAIHEIVKLDEKYGGSCFIYVDEGYGEYPTEQLHLIGKKMGNGLEERVVSIQTNSSIVTTDIFTGEKKSSPVNVVVVKTMVLYLERGWIRLPEEEALVEDMNKLSSLRLKGIIPLENVLETYVIERYTSNGRPIYKSTIGDDHSLSALMYAVFGINQYIRPIHIIDDVFGSNESIPLTTVARPDITRAVYHNKKMLDAGGSSINGTESRLIQTRNRSFLAPNRVSRKGIRGGRSLW